MRNTEKYCLYLFTYRRKRTDEHSRNVKYCLYFYLLHIEESGQTDTHVMLI